MNWNHDLSHAPRDGSHVILAMPNKTTLRSYWCEPKNEPAHWCMLSHKNEPVAWMPWPKHPFEMERSTESSFETGREEADNARKAVPETEDGSVTHAGAGESPATQFILEDCGSGA